MNRLTLSGLQYVNSLATQNDLVLTAVSQISHSLNITTSVKLFRRACCPNTQSCEVAQQLGIDSINCWKSECLMSLD